MKERSTVNMITYEVIFNDGDKIKVSVPRDIEPGHDVMDRIIDDALEQKPTAESHQVIGVYEA